MEDEELEEDLPVEQQSIREKRIAQLAPYQYKKGQSGNSLGRYVGGLSGKERLKRKIAGMTDDEFEEFIEGINKKDLFELAEGRPESKTDLYIKELPKPILNVIPTDNSNQEDTSSKEEN